MHCETRRLVPGAKYAALFLHGIVGTPNHFRQLMPLEDLVPENWSVINVRYPGHGGNVLDFGRSGMDQWRCHAYDAFEDLARNHEKVLIVGHSMGTLFALQLAVENPDKTGALFLLAVPMRPWPRPVIVSHCLRLVFHRIREDHPWEAAFQRACGVSPSVLVWRYLSWIPGLLELFGEICRTQKIMGNLRVPCFAWQSEKDELVGRKTTSVLKSAGNMEIRELTESTHFYYAPEEAEQVRAEFAHWIKKVSG